MEVNKNLLKKATNLLHETQSTEQLFGLSTLINMYIDRPTKNYKEVLEIYCDLIESSIELDTLEEKQTKYVK